MGGVHVIVDGETGLFIKSLKLTVFSFHGPELGGKPGGRCGKGNRPGFYGGDRGESVCEAGVVKSDEFIRV